MSSSFTLAYVSSSTHLLSQDQLKGLLENARKNNHANGISGILLYNDGNFLQVLEGPEEVVRKTFSRIMLDPRHKGIITLLARSFPERYFPDWSMGYIRCSEQKKNIQMPGFTVLLEQDSAAVLHDEYLPGPIRDLLRSFHRVVYKTSMRLADVNPLDCS